MVKKTLKNIFYAGQLEIKNASDRKQILICSIFNLTGCLLLLLYGTHSALQQNYLLAIIDFSVCIVNGLNYFYLRKTGDYVTSSLIVVWVMGTLCLYLFYSGGTYKTGPLWSFMMPSLIFLILGLKRGRIVLSLFALTILGIMLVEDKLDMIMNYSPAFSFRFIGVFFSISVIAYAYEYTLEDGRNELLNLNKELDLLSRRDSLTGLSNRRDILERIEHEVSRCERNEETFCVLMADIDDFKQVNDSEGHDFGDLVLKKVGKALSQTTQKRDCVARWGGEEFLILLSDSSLENGIHIAERLRKKVAAMECKVGQISKRVTLSIGVAQYDKTVGINDLVKNADHSMYIAKEKGKNTIASAISSKS